MKLNTLEAVCATGFGGAVSDGLHMNTIFDRYPPPGPLARAPLSRRERDSLQKFLSTFYALAWS